MIRLRTGLWIVAWVAVTVLAAGSASRLRIEVEAIELLPDDTPAAMDYRLFLNQFGGIEDLYLLVRSADATPDEVTDAAARLAEALATLPDIERVSAGVEPEDEAFFVEEVLPLAPLLVERPLADVETLLQPESIRERVDDLRRGMFGPVGGAAVRWATADPLGFGAQLLTSRTGGLSVDPMTGAFFSEEHNAALLIASPTSATLDPAAGKRILAGIESAIERLQRDSPVRFEVFAVGGPLYAAQDERSIRADLVGTALSSLLAIGLVLLAYFRSAAIPFVLTVAVFTGLIWAAGLTAILTPTLSVLGIAFASILIGLGVDYGIHGATRFRQRLDLGEGVGPAMQAAIAETRGGILSSVATTAVVFGVLLLASFQPLQQLGWVVGLGIVTVLLATRCVGVPLAQALSRSIPAGRSAKRSEAPWLSRNLQTVVDGAVALGAGSRVSVLSSATLILVLSIVGIGRLGFDADLRALRPADHPALQAEQALLQTFDLGLESTSLIVSADSMDAALRRAAELAAEIRNDPSLHVRVTSPTDWILPPDLLQHRATRLPRASFRRAASVLERELRSAGFRLEPFRASLETLRAIGAGDPPQGPPIDAVPHWLGETIRQADEQAYVHVRVDGDLGSRIEQWIDDSDRKDVAVASVPRLGRELQQRISADFKRLDLWAFLAVLVVVAASFRGRLQPTLLSLVPVALGSLVTLGVCGWLGLRLDPFTILVAPILLGIGVDDGLHVLHAARHAGGVGPAARHAGQAITLTTLTTSLGFGSLVLSSVPALQRGGMLVAAGVWVCWLATLILLPAIGSLLGQSAKPD